MKIFQNIVTNNDTGHPFFFWMHEHHLKGDFALI